MGPRTRHTAQEGDASPRDERTLVRKVQINPKTPAKDLRHKGTVGENQDTNEKSRKRNNSASYGTAFEN